MPQTETPQQVLLVLTQQEVDVIKVSLAFAKHKASMPAVRTACAVVSHSIEEKLKEGGRVYEG